MAEVVSQGNNDVNSGFVFVEWHKHTTLWDYDRKAMDGILHFQLSCWPVQCLCYQICCPSSFCMRILKPIVYALADKRARSRAVIHDVSESETLKNLESFGILKDMLPTEMGGSLKLDLPEWMENRRAVELEEI